MKLLTLLIIFCATSAVARMPQGPPPWSCFAISACGSDDSCVQLVGPKVRFDLIEISENNRFVVLDFHGKKKSVALFDSLQQANRAVSQQDEKLEFSIVLIRSNFMADAHAFRLYGTYQNGHGKNFISEEYQKIACVRLRKL